MFWYGVKRILEHVGALPQPTDFNDRWMSKRVLRERDPQLATGIIDYVGAGSEAGVEAGAARVGAVAEPGSASEGAGAGEVAVKELFLSGEIESWAFDSMKHQSRQSSEHICQFFKLTNTAKMLSERCRENSALYRSKFNR